MTKTCLMDETPCILKWPIHAHRYHYVHQYSFIWCLWVMDIIIFSSIFDFCIYTNYQGDWNVCLCVCVCGRLVCQCVGVFMYWCVGAWIGAVCLIWLSNYGSELNICYKGEHKYIHTSSVVRSCSYMQFHDKFCLPWHTYQSYMFHRISESAHGCNYRIIIRSQRSFNFEFQ